MNKIEISGTPPNLAVKVDGVMLPVTSADLHVDCRSGPQLTVSILGFDVDVQTEADVHIGEHEAHILQALGWTPPAADGAKPDMSDEEFATRLRKWIRINPQEFQQWIDKYNRIHYGTTVR